MQPFRDTRDQSAKREVNTLAIVTMNTDENSPTLGMGDLDFSGWLNATFIGFDSTTTGTGGVFLRNIFGGTPTAPDVPYETLLIRGTDLVISPDDGANMQTTGTALSTRTGSGVITEFTYGIGIGNGIA
ncbi:MAG: hypothetical protein ACRCU5_03170, partial [Rhizobiaceae bacterium]